MCSNNKNEQTSIKDVNQMKKIKHLKKQKERVTGTQPILIKLITSRQTCKPMPTQP